jgi:hypothetical protein
MEKIDIEQAYRVMLCFLEDYLSRGDSDVSIFLATYAYPLPDGRPSDPAAWEDWLNAVEAVRGGKFSDLKT